MVQGRLGTDGAVRRSTDDGSLQVEGRLGCNSRGGKFPEFPEFPEWEMQGAAVL